MSTHCRHSVYLPDLGPAGGTITLEGDEARHAVRVKRVQPGQRVAVLDGQGRCVITEVAEAGRTLALRVLSDERAAPPSPRVELYTATPKGPRAGTMIDVISQAGADAWVPLRTAFGTETVKDNRRDRLERVAVEALKQCGRPWLLELGEETTIEEACDADEGAELVIADVSGEAYTPAAHGAVVRVLIGPEGGWRDDERERAIALGARACRFGPYVMRIETAAAAAATIVRDAWGRR